MTRVVLVGPRKAGNLGMTARAMKNFGLSELVLVAPECQIDDESWGYAVRARDVLENVRIVDDLAAATADCTLIAGTTARDREQYSSPVHTPRSAAPILRQASQTSPVALVFGRENSGLTNQELDLCNLVVHIPSSPELPSLNLAQSVVIMAYELFNSEAGPASPPPAPGAQSEAFFAQLAEFLVTTGYTSSQHAETVLRPFRLIARRANLDAAEIQMLMGVISHGLHYRQNP